MQILKPGGDLSKFLEEGRHRQAHALLLDFDGTLAPFHIQRDQSFPYPGVREELRQIQESGHTRLVVISGRTINDIQPLLGLDPSPEIWGAHGWERLQPDGTFTQLPLSDAASNGLHEAYDFAIQAGLSAALEQKRTSIALHWRGQPPERIQTVRDFAADKWEPLTTTADLAIHQFDGGLELRAPGHDKGDAVRTLLAEMGSDIAVAYLGDDATDEDAFAALQGVGLSVLVRKELKPTLANLWLQPPEELLSFLADWRHAFA